MTNDELKAAISEMIEYPGQKKLKGYRFFLVLLALVIFLPLMFWQIDMWEDSHAAQSCREFQQRTQIFERCYRDVGCVVIPIDYVYYQEDQRLERSYCERASKITEAK